MTDLDRWSNRARLSPEWAERARFASRLAPAGLRILDIGCGGMDVERLFSPASYHPVDVVARDERTHVLDLNSNAIPPDLLKDVDIVTMLGVIEYIDDIDPHLRNIAENGVKLLVTYNSTDRCENRNRRGDGWVNDFTTQDLVRKLENNGFDVEKLLIYAEQQVVILATPKRRAEPTAGEPAPRRHQGRESLILVGFFGRGNCGDEAILQCVFEAFREKFDLIVSVDEHGAYPGFWDWYPYNKTRIIHQTNLGEAATNPAVAGVLVGGGGLPVGFGANQIVAARFAERMTAIAGVDMWSSLPGAGAGGQDAMRSYLSLFDFASVREAPAPRPAWLSSVALHHGGDWALRLDKDAAEDIRVDRKRVLITLREYAIERLAWSYSVGITGLIDAVRARGLTPTLLPFCPEDERFLKETGLDRSAEIERHWWNPRRMKQIIASSGMMLSVGRLHPLIFAADVGTPVAAVRPAHVASAFELGKLILNANELGVELIEMSGVAGFLDNPRAADPAKVAASKIRTDEMVASLLHLFARQTSGATR